MQALLDSNSNVLIVYQQSEDSPENCLIQERLERYELATRSVTKEKLLQGSHFVYQALKTLGFSESVCQQAFSCVSSYLIPLPKGHLSYSNSGDFHVLAYSPKGTCGVDLEEYRNRSELVYDKFLGKQDVADKKLMFYQKWLEKEIIFKCPNATQVTYKFFEDYLLGYFFEDSSELMCLYL